MLKLKQNDEKLGYLKERIYLYILKTEYLVLS
jgi:hypothetical protein